MGADNTLNVNNLMDKVELTMMREPELSTLRQKAEKCAGVTDGDRCTAAFKIIKCFYDDS